MQRLLRGGVILILLFCVALLFSVFSSVTSDDAAAKLHVVNPWGQLAQALPAMAFAVSENGMSVEGPICKLPPNAKFKSLPRRLAFSNIMGTYLPILATLGNSFGPHADVSGSATPLPTATLEWDAEILSTESSLSADAITAIAMENKDCRDKIIRAVYNGQCVDRVATVYRLRRSKQVIAVQFQQECLVPDIDGQHPKLAPDLVHPSAATRIKQWFGLIDEKLVPVGNGGGPKV